MSLLLALTGGAPPASPAVGYEQPNPVLRVSFFATCLALTACIGTPNTLPLNGKRVIREAVVTRYEPRKVQQPDQVSNILPLTAVTQNPFYQVDWSNPLIRRVTQVDPIPDLLTSTLNQAVNQTPFQKPDQPNPVLRIPPDRSQIPPDLLTSTLNQAVNQTPFQVPEQPNPLLRKVQQPFDPPNLLTNILGVVAAPFYQNDQPNPTLNRKVQQPDLLFNLYTTGFAPNPIPAFNFDQPNPTLRVRTVQPENPPNLTSKLLPPFAQTDWPNAVLRVPPDRSQIPPNLIATTLNQAVNQNPFQRPDQVFPVLRLRTVQPEPPPNLMASTLGALTPFVWSGQPNPVLRTRMVQVDPVPDLLTSTLNQAVNQTPFQVPEQPNPVLRVRTVQPENPQNLIPVQTTVPIVVARRVPLSTRYTPRQVFQTDIPPNPINFIYFVAPTKPFKQTEWPVHRRRFDLLSQVFDTTRYDTELYPFSQDNWPNPAPRIYKGYTQDNVNTVPLAAQQQVTFRIPVVTPVLRVRTVQPEIPINIRPLTGPQQPPFTQSNQPNQSNPNIRVRTVQPENPINIALNKTAPIPPFFLRNQPNPRMRVNGYWVFQFDRLNLSLQPAVWGGINDAQTPGWNATGSPCTVDSTIGTADSTLYTADMDCSATWGTINDSDTPGWTPIVDSQSPAWSKANDADTPGWTPVITDPGGSSSS